MTARTKHFLKIFALFVILLIVIITSGCIWNAAAGVVAIGTFEVVLSVINFIVEMIAIIYLGKKVLLEEY